MKMKELTPKGLYAMFEGLRTILHSGKLASRVQYMIEVLFAIRKDGFKVLSMSFLESNSDPIDVLYLELHGGVGAS